MRLSKGFSLIELLTVVAIVGILASVGIVSYNSYVWSTKKTSVKNIMQQMSLAQTEYISNTGSYFESSTPDACDTTATKTQSTEINTRLLESETLDPDKLKFNLCVVDTSTDVPYISDYTVIAQAADGKKCKLQMHSNGSWEKDKGDDC